MSELDVLAQGDRGRRIIDMDDVFRLGLDGFDMLEALPRLAEARGLGLRVWRIDGGRHHGGWEIEWWPLAEGRGSAS